MKQGNLDSARWNWPGMRGQPWGRPKPYRISGRRPASRKTWLKIPRRERHRRQATGSIWPAAPQESASARKAAHPGPRYRAPACWSVPPVERKHPLRMIRQEIVPFSSKICGFPPSREILDIGPTGLPAPRSSQLFSDGEKDCIGSPKY